MIPADETESLPRELALAAIGQSLGATAPTLYATIKPRSKYAYQSGRGGHPVMMRVTHLEEDSYAFHLDNGNRYRREDLTFFAQSPEGKLLKLT